VDFTDRLHGYKEAKRDPDIRMLCKIGWLPLDGEMGNQLAAFINQSHRCFLAIYPSLKGSSKSMP